MPPIHLTATAGPDGRLVLDIPTGEAGVVFDVVVTPKATESAATRDAPGWPPGHLDAMYGCITDDTFVAPSRTMPKFVAPLDTD